MENFPRGKTAVVAAATFGLGEAHGYTAMKIAAQAGIQALDAVGLKTSDANALFICLPEDMFSGLSLAEYYGIRPKITDNNRTGGSASVSHMVHAALARSRDRIDGNRLRRTRGWMTAVEYDHASPHWETLVSREDVYRKASCAIKLAVLDSTNKREERLAVREAILGTLEHFSVITRTRGGRPWSAHKVEDV